MEVTNGCHINFEIVSYTIELVLCMILFQFVTKIIPAYLIHSQFKYKNKLYSGLDCFLLQNTKYQSVRCVKIINFHII